MKALENSKKDIIFHLESFRTVMICDQMLLLFKSRKVIWPLCNQEAKRHIVKCQVMSVDQPQSAACSAAINWTTIDHRMSRVCEAVFISASMSGVSGMKGQDLWLQNASYEILWHGVCVCYSSF